MQQTVTIAFYNSLYLKFKLQNSLNIKKPYSETHFAFPKYGRYAIIYSGLNLNQDKAMKPQTVQDSTEPIHLVLQHLRESFSLS